MKLLATSLGVLAITLSSLAKAQDAISDFFGFHYELIQPNTFTPIAVNVTQNREGLHSRSINDTFGTNNEVGLKTEAGLNKSDVIWVKDGSDWLQIYYNNVENEVFGITKGWKAIGLGNQDMGAYFIPLNSGLFIQSRKDFEWYIAWTGYIKQQPMYHEVIKGFNVLNSGYPTQISLNDSKINLSKGFKKGDALSGDIIWIYRGLQNNLPVYDRYYYSEGDFFFTEGWKKVGNGDMDAGEDTILNTLIIETRGDGGTVVVYPPVGFPDYNNTSPLAPIKAEVYTLLTLDEFGDPFFNVLWEARAREIDYTTQIWDEFSKEWWNLNTLWGEKGEVLSNWAAILGLQRGVGRVKATWQTQKRQD